MDINFQFNCHTVSIKMRTVYQGEVFNWSAALVITTNFCVNIAESELESRGTTEQGNIFNALDIFFISFYIFEITINIYVHWFWEFWTNRWNIFDFIVVSVSIVEIIVQAVVGSGYAQINILRTMRVFRVLRLFNKFKEMQKIMVALLASLRPVFTALLILVLVISIYSIIGVQLFKEIDPERFGTFSQAWFTILGFATGDAGCGYIYHPEQKKKKQKFAICIYVYIYMW